MVKTALFLSRSSSEKSLRRACLRAIREKESPDSGETLFWPSNLFAQCVCHFVAGIRLPSSSWLAMQFTQKTQK